MVWSCQPHAQLVLNRVVFVLDWLASKARDPSLAFYLIYSWEVGGER